MYFVVTAIHPQRLGSLLFLARAADRVQVGLLMCDDVWSGV